MDGYVAAAMKAFFSFARHANSDPDDKLR